MIITRGWIGQHIRPYGLDGKRIENAFSADTEAMTAYCENARRRDDCDEFVTVKLSRLSVAPNSPPDVLQWAKANGIEVDQ